MKIPFLLSVFLLLSFIARAQNEDSIALVKQVDSLIQVSRDLTDKSDFEKAFEVHAVAEKLAVEKLGRESVAYASCCFNRGRVNDFKRNFPEAEKGYLEALEMREKLLGKEHPKYVPNLNNLALIYYDMGNYDKAMPLRLEAISIREKVLGKEHPDYAKSLHNLAILYTAMGNYDKAMPLRLEAISIEEKVLGKEHPDYVKSLHNLAMNYWAMGNYEKAEPLHLETIALWEKVLGKDHPYYPQVLNNIALLYYDMGNYEKAEPLYLEAMAIWEKVLGKEHPDYAQSLNNLAIMYYVMGAYEKAEPLHLETKAIWEKVLGKEHPNYATSLNNLGILYESMGTYEKAEPLLLEAKTIREKVLEKEHPEYAQSLNNLANHYKDMGAYEKAEPLYLEAKAVREKVLGKEHPDYTSSLNNLANLYWAKGNHEKAEPLYQELTIVNQSLLEKAVRHLSERELGRYLNQFSASQDEVLSFAQTSGSKKGTAACYDNSLFYKGFLLQATGQLKRLSLSDPTVAEKFNLLKGYERRLTTQYAQPIAERDSTAVAALVVKANDLEKELARTVSGFGNANRQVKWQEVQSALKPGEASVEFVHYRYYQKKQTDSTMYAALVLLPGTSQPSFIPLFEEKQLDSLLQTQGERRADYVNGLYSVAERGIKPLSSGQKSLYELLWQPIEAVLNASPGTGKTLYFSPTGLLHRLNLGAVPIPPSVGGRQGEAEEETLADRYRLVEIGSTRQLVVPHTLVNSEKTAMLLAGFNTKWIARL